MESIDKLPTPKGEVNIKVYEHGQLILDETTDNLVVSLGRDMICQLLSGNTGYDIQQVGFGTNGTATSITDTALSGPPFIKAIGSITRPSSTSMLINFTLGTTEANGMVIQELGLFNATPTLFSRMVRGAITKTSAISLVCTWKLTF